MCRGTDMLSGNRRVPALQIKECNLLQSALRCSSSAWLRQAHHNKEKAKQKRIFFGHTSHESVQVNWDCPEVLSCFGGQPSQPNSLHGSKGAHSAWWFPPYIHCTISGGTYIHNPPTRAEKYNLPKDLHSGSLSGLQQLA